MTRFDAATVVLAAALAASTIAPAFAQNLQAPSRPAGAPAPETAAPQAPVVVYQNSETAQDVRQQLNEVLSHYPPTLRQLFRLDPTLLTRADYIASYPQLTAFVQQHPEVVRNPTFFFGEPDFERTRTDRERALDTLRGVLDGVGFLAGFLTVISLLYALLRQGIEYRRWRRQVQIQTDVHTKLLDRMTNNQELLAYMDTAAGRRFLEVPMPMAASSPASTLTPFARILWSVQIGVVVVATGAGFWIATTTLTDADLSSVFQVMGSLAMAVGIGFIVSALLSWALSLRMGLISLPAPKVE